MNTISRILWQPSIIGAISQWREAHPDKIAFTFLGDNGQKDDETTYIELHQQVMNLAGLLSERGLKGERIVIVLPSGIDYVVSFLACLASGAIAVPLYPPGGKRDWHRMRSVLEDCNPRALVVNRAVAARYQEEFAALMAARQRATFVIDELAVPESGFSPGDIDPKRIAFLQYTSGSTGNPKGVMVSHENIMHNAHNQAFDMGNGVEAVDVSWLPLYHDMGLIGKILQSLSIGAHAVFMSPFSFLRRPVNWLNAITQYKGTVSGAPNFAFDLCVDKIKESDIDALDLSTWKVAFNGSEPVKMSTLDRFAHRFERAGFRREAFFPCYGLAEATLYVAGGPLHQLPHAMELDRAALSEGQVTSATLPADHPDYAERVVSCVSVDLPFRDQTMRIVDPATWSVLPERRVGEIWLKSRSVARGYWNKPAETAETFQAYTTESGEGPFLRTGDLGFLNNGRLYITGRIKELIIINGVNHYPQDIEETVQSLSDAFRVHAGAAFGFDDDKLGIVQGINRAKVSPEELQALIAQLRQAVWQVHGVAPAYVGLVNPGEIAKTSSGKIQRGVVRRRFLAKELPLLAEWRSEAGGADEAVCPPIAAEGAEPSAPRGAASTTGLSPLAERKIAWIRDYFATRVSSFLIDERRTIPPYVILDLGNQGLLGMLAPRSHGGLELSTRDFLGILETLGSKDMTLALFVGLNNALGVRPIARFATPSVQEGYLPLLATGRELAAFALTEPAAGSNPQAIQAFARQRPDGSYVVSGTKYWSGSAAWSGVMNVFAKSVDSQGRANGITAFAIPQSSPGVRQGPEALTMGMRGMIQNTIFFEDVEVNASQVLGKPGHGMGVAQDTMCYGRIAISAVCLGALKLCYSTMLQYAAERDVSTGRLLQNPHARWVLTETMHAISALEALIGGVASRMDVGERVPQEVLAVCKCFSTEWLWTAVDRTMQMVGGRGYVESNFIPQLFRDARIFRIFEGPTETLNHYIGSSAVKNRQAIREYLQTQLDGAAVAKQYDAVIERACAAGGAETVAQNWLYSVVGDYVNLLVVHATGLGYGLDPAASRWLREQVERTADQLEASLGRFEDIGSVEAIHAFGERLVTQLGRHEQSYPLPNGTRDPLLFGTGGDRPATPPLATEPIIAVRQPEPLAAATTAAQPAANRHDIQSFVGRWVARRCNRPVDAIGPDVEFAMLGLGSIDSFELSLDLSREYSLDIDPTVFWNYPNVKALAGFVRGELEAQRR